MDLMQKERKSKAQIHDRLSVVAAIIERRVRSEEGVLAVPAKISPNSDVDILESSSFRDDCAERLRKPSKSYYMV
jgi:hypothetical protein